MDDCCMNRFATAAAAVEEAHKSHFTQDSTFLVDLP